MEASDIEINPVDSDKKLLSNLTPKAIPYMIHESLGADFDKKKYSLNDNERTIKKNEPKKKSRHASSDFDEEEDMPDAKDFEEFDYAEKSKSSSSSL